MIRRYLQCSRAFVVMWLLTMAMFVHAQEIPKVFLDDMKTMSPREQVQYIADKCWELGDSDRLSAAQLGELGRSIAKKHKFHHEYANISNSLGVSKLYYDTDIKAALAYFSQAMEAALNGRDSIEIGYTYNNTGDVFYITGNIPLASAYADSSLRYFEALDFKPGLAYTYINLGQIARSRKDYAVAIKHFHQATDLHTELGIKQGISAANLELARTRLALEQYQEALDHYYRSLAITREQNNLTYTANNLVGIGKVNYYLENYPKAISYFDQARQTYIANNHKAGMINVSLGKALVYSKQNEVEQGEIELRKAASLAKELGLPTKILEVKKSTVQFYENIGDFAKSFLETQNALSVYDSIFLNSQLETLHEIRDKSHMQNSLDEARYQIQMQRATGWIMSISLLFIILLTLLIYRNYRTQHKLNAQLQSLNQSKDKLFSIISHDLRKPFASVMQYLELIQDNHHLSEEKQKEYIQHLNTSTRSTYVLLENLLNLSAFRTGKIHFQPSHFNLTDLLNELETSLETQLHDKEVIIKRDIRQEKIFADPKMMEVVIRNLLSNAIKYSNKNSLIWLISKQATGYNLIEVKDEGKGMSIQQLNRLFNSDITQSEPGTLGEKGTGIGLSLCHDFIQEHHGELLAESTEGKGSVFTIRIPDNQQK